jgi:hypothetical protein
MAAAFTFSQGHQVNLGSLASDILFELLDHLSVPDVLRVRQVCSTVSLQKRCTHPFHRLISTLNGSHGTRLSGSGFSAVSNSRCRIFLVLLRHSPLLKRSR